MEKFNYTREELISICERAVVHHSKWQNRDSYLLQKSIQSIHEGLSAGLDFRIVTIEIDKSYHSDDETLIIEFIQPIDFKKLEKNRASLTISSLEDYFNEIDPQMKTEMFNGEGIDFYSNYTTSYMPTSKRLEEVGEGNDWY